MILSNTQRQYQRWRTYRYSALKLLIIGLQSAFAIRATINYGCLHFNVLRNRSYGRSKFTLRECTFWTFSAPVSSETLTLTRGPSYINSTRTPGRKTGCANINFLHQGYRKLSSYRQTDRQVTRGHVTKMAVTPFDPQYSKTHGSIFRRNGVMSDRSSHCGNRLFWTFSAPVTLTMTR